MASSVPGYEYDVFISYRQKDNKYDGWVTEFVSSLRNEIEATFKGEVGIYFDENPHDGLRETHDVDLSLSEKVKALVMIPIVSQTYCDPNSFSWKNEFLPFVEHATNDKFGMDVKVANGNVAKRVLPVKIHEIPEEDKKLFEEAVGSNALRAVDFIYKGPGINRPLRANEDNPHDNQNKTYYRDQINKVANSLKEVLNGIQAANEGKAVADVEGKEPVTQQKEVPVRREVRRRNPVIIAGFVVILAALIYFLYPYLSGGSGSDLDRSIAVLPFADMSPDKDQEYFSEGLAEELLNGLSRVEDIKVAGRTSSFSFKGKEASLKDIGEELGVSYILEGSVRKSGDMLRISAQLIQANNGFQLWSETFDKEYTASNIFDIQDEISRSVLTELKLTFMTDAADTVSNRPTENVEAYNHFLRATQLEISRRPQDLEEAIKSYKQAVELDPDFALAYARLAVAYNLLGSYGNLSHDDNLDLMDDNITKALVVDSEEPYVYYALGLLKHHEGEYDEAYKAMEKALKIQPNFAEAHLAFSDYVTHGDDPDKDKLSEEHLLKAIELDPISPSMRIAKARYYADKGDYDTTFEILDGIIEDNPDFTNSYYTKSIIYSHDLGQIDKAFMAVHQALQKDPNNFRLLVGIKRHATDLGLFDYAEEVLDVMKSNYPENERLVFEEYEIEMMNGNFERALELSEENFRKFLEETPEENIKRRKIGYLANRYAMLCILTDQYEKALVFGEDAIPEFTGDSVYIDEDNQDAALAMFALYNMSGNSQQADRILEAMKISELVPEDTVGISASDWEYWQYHTFKVMEGDYEEALSIDRKDYFDDNNRAHALMYRMNLVMLLMKDHPDYAAFVRDVDADIARMRKNVETYLEESEDWKSELDISLE